MSCRSATKFIRARERRESVKDLVLSISFMAQLKSPPLIKINSGIKYKFILDCVKEIWVKAVRCID